MFPSASCGSTHPSGSRIELSASTTGTSDDQTQAAWRVDDLAAELAELRSRGFEVLEIDTPQLSAEPAADPDQPRAVMPHIDATGVQTYYEDHGRGDPVMLLHGGLESSTDWQRYTAALRDHHRVLIPDRRGHGRTPDVDGPYTYDAMAAETIALLEQRAGGPTHLVGYSDGGNIALLIARDRPDLVRSLVTIAANIDVDGLVPQFVARLEHPDPASPRLAAIRRTYEATTPDGAEHWATFYDKVAEMGRTGPGITTDDLTRITCPVLVIIADDDIVTLDHAITMRDALDQGQLAVIPGASHLLHHERPELLNALIQAFLTDPTPHPLMPIRRAPNTGDTSRPVGPADPR